MATEVLLLLLRLNLIAGAAIALVLLLRPHVRRWFGAHQAYQFWWTVPVALVGALIPSTETWGDVGPFEAAVGRAGGWLSSSGSDRILLTAWAAGVFASLGVVAWRYVCFLAQERSGRAGPAIVGILTPRLVTPRDFAARFTLPERQLVRAHERAHIDRLDARYNAVTLLLTCVNWFNPLAHVAARAMRFDQELACDATVMHRRPTDRRLYAETLLHSQCRVASSPLGCDWSGQGARLLMTRLTTLMARRPGDGRGELGDTLLAVLWISVFAAAWAAQPPSRIPEEIRVLTIAAPGPTATLRTTEMPR